MEISGFFLCLVGAARITHRAQRLVSIATRWHMLVTCASSSGPDQPKAHIDHSDRPDYIYQDDQRERCSQSADSDHPDHFMISVPPQGPSSFQTRQALGNNQTISTTKFILIISIHVSLICFS